MGFFNWIRSQVCRAFVMGVNDGMAQLGMDNENAQTDVIEAEVVALIEHDS